MKKLFNIRLKSDSKVHAHNPMEHNFTICMKALTEQHEEYEETVDKITCEACIRFITYCKQFKASELKPTRPKSEPLQITKDDLVIRGASIDCENIKDGMLSDKQMYKIETRIVQEELMNIDYVNSDDIGFLTIRSNWSLRDDSILEPIALIINDVLKRA